MRIGRTLPPAASPIPLVALFRSLSGLFHGQGSRGEQFAREIRQEFRIRHCFFLSSGKAALVLILQALHEIHPERDLVVLPAFTCYSVPAAVKRAGLQLCLCDSAPESFDFDREKLRILLADEALKRRILCLLPSHLFGCSADVAYLQTIIGQDIFLVEDAAQAMGERSGPQKLGTLADIGFFSLGRGKALSTIEGGVIVTNRDDLAGRITSRVSDMASCSQAGSVMLLFKALAITLLQRPALFWLPKALPFLKLGETIYDSEFSLRQISAVQLQLARKWQQRLETHRRARLRNIAYWQQNLPEGLAQLRPPTGNSLVRLPIIARSRRQRDDIVRQSELQGLGIMPVYPAPIHRIADLANDFLGQEYPQAEDLCNRLLTVPVHEQVTARDNERILSLLTNLSMGRGLGGQR
nr:DegT/DnrJ/EryC1/StrS family aminotransferase [Desulfogranum mediterraneum]